MVNWNVLIAMWNTNKYQYRTNSAVDSWNYKLKSFKDKQQPNALLKVQKLH